MLVRCIDSEAIAQSPISKSNHVGGEKSTKAPWNTNFQSYGFTGNDGFSACASKHHARREKLVSFTDTDIGPLRATPTASEPHSVLARNRCGMVSSHLRGLNKFRFFRGGDERSAQLCHSFRLLLSPVSWLPLRIRASPSFCDGAEGQSDVQTRSNEELRARAPYEEAISNWSMNDEGKALQAGGGVRVTRSSIVEIHIAEGPRLG
ncbi:hypothetical protein F4802DRAFT_505030 [Xylaria palmicola]|nr:hypothetical protein F4802DRAFT_505030 [Xylaria palmicola]